VGGQRGRAGPPSVRAGREQCGAVVGEGDAVGVGRVVGDRLAPAGGAGGIAGRGRKGHALGGGGSDLPGGGGGGAGGGEGGEGLPLAAGEEAAAHPGLPYLAVEGGWGGAGHEEGEVAGLVGCADAVDGGGVGAASPGGEGAPRGAG